MHANIPVLLFVYRHFTKYKLFIHSKLIIVFCCRHITCSALIYSHLTSPLGCFVCVVSQILKLFCGMSQNGNIRICLQSLNKNICTHAHHQIGIGNIAFKHVTQLCLLFLSLFFPNFKTVLWHITKRKFTHSFTVTKPKHMHSYTSPNKHRAMWSIPSSRGR